MQAERELLQREAEVRQREAELLAIERDRQLQNERAPPPTEQRPEVPSDPLMMAFLERIKYRRYRWEDFDDVVFAPDLQISRDMVGLMTESRYAADIAYFLGKNPQITAEIASAIAGLTKVVTETLEKHHEPGG